MIYIYDCKGNSTSSNLFALVGPSLLGKAIDAMDLEKTGGVVLFDVVLHYATLMVIFYILYNIFK